MHKIKCVVLACVEPFPLLCNESSKSVFQIASQVCLLTRLIIVPELNRMKPRTASLIFELSDICWNLYSKASRELRCIRIIKRHFIIFHFYFCLSDIVVVNTSLVYTASSGTARDVTRRNPGPQLERYSPASLCLPVAGIKGVQHHPRLQ